MTTDIAQTNANKLVEIKNLHTFFYLTEGVVRAVNGVDLDIRRGETLGVVGESGCGKSITAMSLMQLVPSPGRIVDGEILFHRTTRSNGSGEAVDVVKINDLEPNSRDMRRIRGAQISMVFQEPMTAMSPVRTVGVQITEAIQLHQGVNKAEARDIAIELMERVRLANPERTIDDYPFQLSGGMRQRVMIALALSLRADLVVADEATTSLDVIVEAQFLDLLRELCEEFELTILLITHNIGIVAELADRIAVMYAGRLVELGGVHEVFAGRLHPYADGLLKAVPNIKLVDDELYKMPGSPPDLINPPKGCRFHPRCPKVMDVCRELDPSLNHIEPNWRVNCWLYQKIPDEFQLPEGRG